jgi:hypothetical protein
MHRLGQRGPLVLFGRPATGESHLALDLLAQLANQSVRFVFFDMRANWKTIQTTLSSGRTAVSFWNRLVCVCAPHPPRLAYQPSMSSSERDTELAGRLRNC